MHRPTEAEVAQEMLARLKARMARDGIRIEQDPLPTPSDTQRSKTGGSGHCAPATCPPNRNPGTHCRATAALTCRRCPRASRTTAT